MTKIEVVHIKSSHLPLGIAKAKKLIEQLNDFSPKVIDEALDKFYDKYQTNADNIIDGVEEYMKRWQ